MTSPELCPLCESPIPVDAPVGGCPRCLLAEGFEGHAADRVPDINTLAEAFPELEILDVIGSGGMGVVYRARQRSLDRIVALKVLPPDIADDPRFADRFAREARALARLSHPHIVGVHESGDRDGLYFLLMEYVDGTNLRHAIRNGHLAPAEALAIVPQICDALQYAHEQGIVHRDVKPENILLGKDGRVRIADFGLAKLLDPSSDEHTLTKVGQVMGTPHYMAPEQIEHPAEVDHRADIYALGVVFYEMLTGELPIGRFAPPSRKVEVDVRLDAVVLRALEKEPEQRYQKAGQVRTEVNSIVMTPEDSSASTAPASPHTNATSASASSTTETTSSRSSAPPTPPPAPPKPTAPRKVPPEPPRHRWWHRREGERKGHSIPIALAALMTALLCVVPIYGLFQFLMDGATDELAKGVAILVIPVAAALVLFWLLNLVSMAYIWHRRRRGRTYTWMAFFAPLVVGFCYLAATPKLLSGDFESLQNKIDHEFRSSYYEAEARRDIHSLWRTRVRLLARPLRDGNVLRLLDPDYRKYVRDLSEEEFDQRRKKGELGALFVDAEALPVALEDMRVTSIDFRPGMEVAIVTVESRSFRMRFVVLRTPWDGAQPGMREWFFSPERVDLSSR